MIFFHLGFYGICTVAVGAFFYYASDSTLFTVWRRRGCDSDLIKVARCVVYYRNIVARRALPC